MVAALDQWGGEVHTLYDREGREVDDGCIGSPALQTQLLVESASALGPAAIQREAARQRQWEKKRYTKRMC